MQPISRRRIVCADCAIRVTFADEAIRGVPITSRPASSELAAAVREYDADLQCAWKKTAPLWVPNEVAAIRPRQRRGRPKRIASGAPLAEQANRNASWLVAFMRREWRVKHGRERAPRDVMDKMVREAVAEAAKAFRVPESQIDVESVYWNARKTGNSSLLARIRHLLCPKPIFPEVYG